MTLLTLGLVLLAIVILMAIFGFGLLETTFQGSAKILFYVFLIMFLGILIVALTQQYGYDPTPTH
jgi:uncharacterized membrane protein YtjA (UPF0391 family)